MHTLLDLKLADSLDHDRRAAALAQGQKSARRAARKPRPRKS
jgi:hypothetical protein